MRAPYVNGPEMLTPIGEWIAARMPYIESKRPWHWVHPSNRTIRVFGFKPYYGCRIFNYTRAHFYTGQPPWVVVQVFGITIYQRNRRFSGQPNLESPK